LAFEGFEMALLSKQALRQAQHGDVVTVQMTLTPEGNFVPEPLFDRQGEIAFVLGWGNYLPGLHELLLHCVAGDSFDNVALDAGWGGRDEDLVIRLPRDKLSHMAGHERIQVGSVLRLQGGVQVTITYIDDNVVEVDANPPLAGSSYICSLTVLSVESLDLNLFEYQENRTGISAPYAAATLAMGCFWGAELALMRQVGVVGTRVGYSQGIVPDPTYAHVCTGETQHREAVQVVFDTRKVSYEALLNLALQRMSVTAIPGKLNHLFDADDERDSHQYKHGFYYHNEAQRLQAEMIAVSNGDIEVLRAAAFYNAEEHHQQYLYKGGQSARKGAKETIRCFG
jgi:methionine-S-sulfoxide reductase